MTAYLVDIVARRIYRHDSSAYVSVFKERNEGKSLMHNAHSFEDKAAEQVCRHSIGTFKGINSFLSSFIK